MTPEIEKALAVLRDAAKTPKARAAVSVLESELQAGGRAPAGNTPPAKPSGFPNSKDFGSRMAAAKSARGAATA